MPHVVQVFTVPESLLFVRGQVAFMRARGYELSVVSSPGPMLEEFGRREVVPAHALPMARRISPAEDAVALTKLTALFRRIEPDLVHANTPKAGLLGMMAAAAAGVSARVYEMHGSLLYTAQGARRRLLKTTERVACGLASRVVAVSGSLRDFAIDERLAPREKIEVLASGSCNGVDCDGMFDPSRVGEEARDALRRRLGVPHDALVVTFIGRLVREKGVVELVAAWREVRERFPDAHLVVAGVFEERDSVPPETRAALEGDPRLHQAGFVEETPALYSISDVVVLPSYREGFPFVPLEAASMGVPVVASRVPGCVDAVVDGETGTLVPPRDAHAVAEAIAHYLASPPLRALHGAAARERVKEQFRQERVWQALAGLYDELMPTPRASTRTHEVIHR